MQSGDNVTIIDEQDNQTPCVILCGWMKEATIEHEIQQAQMQLVANTCEAKS